MSRAEEIAVGVLAVRARIDEAERAAGRPAGAVRLIAVSKKMPLDDIRAARACGQSDFGENYAQELRDKRAAFRAHPDLVNPRWHYIGPMQSNKVKYLAGVVELIHSLDSPEILREIDRRAATAAGASLAPEVSAGEVSPLAQKCLVQVNVADEPGKSGIAISRLPELLDRFAVCSHAVCVGLMVIPPFSDQPRETRRHFAALRALAERERAVPRPHVELRELSMGMSHDFVDAVAEGATLVRVGTAIFGDRVR